MPVHNCAAHLDESVASILGQTLSDFELVILDNGSTDGSRERLRELARAEARIRLVEVDGPLGVGASSDAVARMARARLIARMDADDVALPERLERQVALLLSAPDVVLVGCAALGIDAQGRPGRPADLRALVRGGSRPPIPHSSVVFTREAFEAVGGYVDEDGGPVDSAFITRMARHGRVLVLTEPLLHYRFVAASATAADELDDASGAAGWSAGERVDEAVRLLYLREAHRLWAGDRPRLLEELVARRLLRPRGSVLRAVAWGLAAQAQPRALRLVLRTLKRAHNAVLRRRLTGVAWVRWTPT